MSQRLYFLELDPLLFCPPLEAISMNSNNIKWLLFSVDSNGK